MPVSASCPSCGAALSEASVLALAPVCSHCGVVITSIGGTLGWTSAYGVDDPTFTRSRIEADLAVCRDYQKRYRGMIEACKQQLDCGVERYAKLPHPPEMLTLEKVPSLWEGVGAGLIMSPLIWFGWLLASVFLVGAFSGEIGRLFPFLAGMSWMGGVLFMIMVTVAPALVSSFWLGTRNHFKVKAANGNRPLENARRQEAYEEAMAAALKAAEPLKAAEDHRLRAQIREVEGRAKTVAEKEVEVRRILGTLQSK